VRYFSERIEIAIRADGDYNYSSQSGCYVLNKGDVPILSIPHATITATMDESLVSPVVLYIGRTLSTTDNPQQTITYLHTIKDFMIVFQRLSKTWLHGVLLICNDYHVIASTELIIPSQLTLVCTLHFHRLVTVNIHLISHRIC